MGELYNNVLLVHIMRFAVTVIHPSHMHICTVSSSLLIVTPMVWLMI